MSCAVLIQTCDRYEKFWPGFFNFFEKHWDSSIDCKIYFCNEKNNVILPDNFISIKNGSGTFVQNLKNSIDQIKENDIFFLLEDFWPIAPMTKDLFFNFYDYFNQKELDAFQVGPYTPYYKLEKTENKIKNRDIWKIKKDSDWLFNFQARFWKKQILKECLVEPEISERTISSAISVEMDSNKIAQQKEINVNFYHYFWYPIGGVAYRGDFTEIGNQMNNIVNIDEMTNKLIS